MSRAVRDLRDMVCVSRLSYRESDDEEVLSEEEGVNHGLSSLSLSDGSSSPASRSSSGGVKPAPLRLQSPDSGFATNGSPIDRGEGKTASKTEASSLSATVVDSKSKNKPSKRKRKKKAMQTLPPQFDLPKPRLLPPVLAEPFMLTEVRELELDSPKGGREPNNRVEEQKGNFDSMLTYMDATMVSEWLTRSNTALEDMVMYCQQGDHYVQFAHFWLSEFPEVQKQEIYQMEHEILVEEVGLAFAVGKEARKVVRRDVTDLLVALFREYPTKLFSTKGTYLFLDHLDILTSDKAERYKKLLADVRCSTRNRQYAQWLLATRSFALVSIWSSVVNFFRNLVGVHGVTPGLPVPTLASGSIKESVYQRRLNQAVRLGFADVVHYLIKSGLVDVSRYDPHGRSLLFSAVMHNKLEVVRYLVTRVSPALDVNQSADTGNTPLHAAANSGNTEIVKVLVNCPAIEVDCRNRQCENATPLHLAVMHGHKGVVEVLVAAGADSTLKMGDLSAVDIARDFDHRELLPLLRS